MKNQPIYQKFIEILEEFEPFRDGKDQKWIFYFKHKRQWEGLRVVKYEHKYYVIRDRENWTLPDDLNESIELHIERWLSHLQLWKAKIAKDSISAQSDLFKKLPLAMRTGVIHRRNLNLLLPEWYDFEKALGPRDFARIVEICECYSSAQSLPEMTLERYLEYCRVAYEANPDTFQNNYHKFEAGLSGREYYTRYADGRSGGLLDIDPHSTEAFSEWYRERMGCHPWEIYRGGSSTRINLYVRKDDKQDGWIVGLCAFSSSRMLEMCRIALAFDKAKLPFELFYKGSYAQRLLKEDWIGIVPEGYGLKYAWHDFPKRWNVADCIYFNWLYAEQKNKVVLKRKLAKIVSWLPEPVTCWLRDKRKNEMRVVLKKTA